MSIPLVLPSSRGLSLITLVSWWKAWKLLGFVPRELPPGYTSRWRVIDPWEPVEVWEVRHDGNLVDCYTVVDAWLHFIRC